MTTYPDQSEIRRQRRAAVVTARAMLHGALGIIEGSRRMLVFRHHVGLGEFDEDFLTFVAIDSETDDLPIGEVRRYWDPGALARKDEEISEAEALYHDTAFEACRSIIRRFSMEFHRFSPLEQQFISRGAVPGGVLILPPDAALDLIQAACSQNVPILGVDSFILSEAGTQSLMEHSLDLSGCGPEVDSWSEAMAFIWQRSHLGFHFEVVLDTSAA